MSVTLKDDSEEVFYRLNGQEDAVAETPFYTVTCKLFGIFPVKDVKVMMVDRQEVTAGGEAIGIYVKTDGILVLGTAKIADAWGNELQPGAESGAERGLYCERERGDGVRERGADGQD